jgi:hypothetical protein
MIMLYTDQPGIYYWDRLIAPKDRESVLLRKVTDLVQWDPTEKPVYWRAEDEILRDPFGLLELLIRRLLVVPYPGLAYTINSQLPKVPQIIGDRIEAGGKWEHPSPDVNQVQELIAELVPSPLLGRAETIASGWRYFSRGKRRLIESALDVALDMKPLDWRKHVKTFLKKREKGILPADVAGVAKQIVAYGVRDWSARPFGGAAHLWLPGYSYVLGPSSPDSSDQTGTEDPLFAFSLRERSEEISPKNVHICGEAFSGNQGFIEGALQTTEAVLETIMGPTRLTDALASLARLAPKDKRKEGVFLRKQHKRINDTWEARLSLASPEP